MDSNHIVIFGIFAVVAYVILTDANVAAAFVYVFKLVNTNIKRRWWWMTNNPANPVVKYIMYRKSLKLAKELKMKMDKYYENR